MFPGSLGAPNCRRLRESTYILRALTMERTECNLATSGFEISPWNREATSTTSNGVSAIAKRSDMSRGRPAWSLSAQRASGRAMGTSIVVRPESVTSFAHIAPFDIQFSGMSTRASRSRTASVRRSRVIADDVYLSTWPSKFCGFGIECLVSLSPSVFSQVRTDRAACLGITMSTSLEYLGGP